MQAILIGALVSIPCLPVIGLATAETDLEQPRVVRSPQSVAPAEMHYLKGLRWLKQEQRADGSWASGSNDVAGTALALLAFSAHGESGHSEEFGGTVNRAIHWIDSQIATNGMIAGATLATHALVLKAELECRTLLLQTNPLLHLQALAHHAAAQQREDGGWSRDARRQDPDLVSTVWMLAAFSGRSETLASLPTIQSQKGVQRLWEFAVDPGFSFEKHKPDPAATALAVCCLNTLDANNPRLSKARFFMEKSFATRNVHDPLPFHAYFFATHALHANGGVNWAAWHRVWYRVAWDAQNADGSWPMSAMTPCETAAIGNSQVHSTALCLWSLAADYAVWPSPFNSW